MPKYDVQHNDFGYRYRQLLLRALARSSTLGLNTWAAFRHSEDGELLLLRTELEQFADLMAVDGALTLDQQVGLLGLGVEIATSMPATSVVYHALKAEAADSGCPQPTVARTLMTSCWL